MTKKLVPIVKYFGGSCNVSKTDGKMLKSSETTNYR